MADPSQKVYTTAAIRAIERDAMDTQGVPASELMQRAGHAALAGLLASWPQARTLTVVCGPGNNGGDGRVLAAAARKAGLAVAVVESRQSTVSLPPADVIVDALFGIGLSRAPSGETAALIEAMNAQAAPVFALDLPSGLDADTGLAPGVAVDASATCTFIGYKRGLFTGAGPRCSGRVACDGLGIDARAYAGHAPLAGVLPANLAAHLLGPRPHDAHKGQSGHVLVVGGNHGMRGAAALAGEAALRSGAGLVSLAVRPGAKPARSELMMHEVADPAALPPLLARASVIAIGPGLGKDEWAQAMLSAVLASDHPLVVDADALNLLRGACTPRADWVLTPHPGEAAGWLGVDTAAVQADRYAAAAEWVALSGGVIVLKGARTQVAAPGALPQVCLAGNPGMAVAGMGDVLTGVIAALRAQGLTAWDAACAGVQLHAEAGDVAAAAAGERGMLASDLMTPLHRRVNGLDL